MSSPLARFSTLGQEPDDANARKAARDAWQKHGIVLINPSWLSGWADRKQLEVFAERLFGKRGEPSADPSPASRRPSNDRITLKPITTTTEILCRECMGDGWHQPAFGRPSGKRACKPCEGTGRQTILLIEKRPTDLTPKELTQ